MTDTTQNTWSLVEGHKVPIEIIVPSTLSIGGLKDVIYSHCKNPNFEASKLRCALYYRLRVDTDGTPKPTIFCISWDNADFNSYEGDILAGTYRPQTDEVIKRPWNLVLP